MGGVIDYYSSSNAMLEDELVGASPEGRCAAVRQRMIQLLVKRMGNTDEVDLYMNWQASSKITAATG